jgi:uncharacterized protein
VLDELSATEFHDLDRATCLWLLPTEQVGRLRLLDPDGAMMPVNYLVADGALVVRVEAGAGAVECSSGSPVAFDVDVVDVFSQVGWSVHVRGEVVDVTDVISTDQTWRGHVQPWTRRPDDRWLRIIITDVSGRWFRPPDRPWAFTTAGRLWQ